MTTRTSPDVSVIETIVLLKVFDVSNAVWDVALGLLGT